MRIRKKLLSCLLAVALLAGTLALPARAAFRDIRDRDTAVAAAVLEGLGIEPGWLSRYPAELSGGELQRFCIARALGEGTRYLLADEMTTMLDLITQSQIWGFLLAEARRRDIGVLAVSHVEPLLARIASRVEALPEQA